MNRQKTIKKFYDKIEKGYLNIKPNDCPLQSVDNALEVTGKLFMALTKEERILNRDLIIKLLNGLESNYLYGQRIVCKDEIEFFKGLKWKDSQSFIPRTKALQRKEPKDSKPDRWEKVKPKTWYRTDVSYSQFTYLLQGLRLVDSKLTNKAMVYITENDFVIKRHDGKLARNGSFQTPWPNVQLRKYFIKELTGAKHNWLEKFWFGFMKCWPWNTRKDNGINSLLLYYSVGGISNNLKIKMKDFIDKWMSEFKPEELKDELEWLLMDKIRSELCN